MPRFLLLGIVLVTALVGGNRSAAHAQPVSEPEPHWSLASVTIAGQAVGGVPAFSPSGASTIGSRPKSSEITVSYHNAPTNVQAAFERAVETWEGLIVSSAEIRVEMTWETFDANLLGQANISSVKKEAGDAHLPLSDVLYPTALANALRGTRTSDTPMYQSWMELRRIAMSRASMVRSRLASTTSFRWLYTSSLTGSGSIRNSQ